MTSPDKAQRLKSIRVWYEQHLARTPEHLRESTPVLMYPSEVDLLLEVAGLSPPEPPEPRSAS